MKITTKKESKHFLHELLEDFSALGSFSFQAVLGVFLILTDIALFRKYFISMAGVYLVLAILRSLYFEKRPGVKTSFKTLLQKVDDNSRFSSHSATSFTLAIVIGINTSAIVLIFLLLLATLIAISRIILKKHYLPNILTGIVIGVVIGLTFHFLVL